jgi:Bacterial dipeptidyl-peptidase Sh3 domain
VRHLVAAAPFYRSADGGGEVISELKAGDEYWLLDDTRGWAWGYAGKDRRVGYVRAAALGL